MKFATKLNSGTLLHYLGKLKIQAFCRCERKRKQIAFSIASETQRSFCRGKVYPDIRRG